MDEQEIRRKIKRGYPSGELRTELLEKGLSEQEIDKLIQGASSESAMPATKWNGWMILCSGFLITGLGLMAVPEIWLSALRYPLIIAGSLGLIAIFVMNLSRK